MLHVHAINGWESFAYVKQDEEGLVAETSGGLYTANLMNCMCLMLYDGSTVCGMLHLNPRHHRIDAWVTALRERVNATEAVVTGANGGTQVAERVAQLEHLLDGLTVIDETKAQWLQGSRLNPVAGSHRSLAGWAAVDTNGSYALSAMPPEWAAVAQQPRRTGRKSSDGCCIVM